MKALCIIILCCSSYMTCWAGNADVRLGDSATQEQTMLASTAKTKYKSPWIAGALSIVPGMGQLYVNKHKYWWKGVAYPIGIALLALAVDFNEKRYQTFRSGYNDYVRASGIDKVDSVGQHVDPMLKIFFEYKDSASLLRARDFYLGQREFWVVFTVVGWVVNILDAVVYAHLSGIDIGNKARLYIRPKFPEVHELMAGTSYGGLSFSLQF